MVMRADRDRTLIPTPLAYHGEMTGTRVLVVEDDPTVADVVSRYLEREGFAVERAADGQAAIKLAMAAPPDLMVLDLMLPGLDGLEVFRRVRESAPIPVIMLTARGDESDRVAGLDLGADDYVAKPFSPRELIARVKSVLRRSQGALTAAESLPPRLSAGSIEVDVGGRIVQVGGRPASLTVREFELLVFLMAHPRRVFRRQDLLQRVWGYTFGDMSTVTVHVRRLREKVEQDPSLPQHIKTVWGVGYRFEP
jgi:DNA-binding response OmpR family regulator